MRDSGPEQIGGLTGLFGAFMELADRLEMSGAERAGILGVSEASLALGPAGLVSHEAEARRRIDYAMPLMERLLANLARS